MKAARALAVDESGETSDDAMVRVYEVDFFEELPAEDFRAQIETKLFGPIRLSC